MRLRHAGLALWVAPLLALAASRPAVADGINAQPSPSPGGPAAGSVYYVTEVFDRAVARVVIGSDGRATVDPKFVSGLPPSGPDSAVFTADGRMLISNLSAGTVSVVDPTSGRVITPQLNSMPIDTLADLAVDPSGEVVWGISHSGSGPMAIDRIALNGGQVTPSNPSGVEALGGIAFSESGRLFVSSQTGMIAELSPSDGHLLQSVHVDGAPDGMTVDPQTGHLFASGCNGLCEVDVGDSPGAPMRLVRVHGAANGDGIAADGKGHIVIASDQCCLVQLTIATDQVVTVADSIPSADDVAPVVGAGAPTAANCAALASCFGSDTGAGLGAVGVAVVLALGTTGLLRRLPDPPLGAAAPHDAPQPAATGQAQPAAGAGHEQTAAATGHEQTAAATGHEQAAAATRHEHHAAGSPHDPTAAEAPPDHPREGGGGRPEGEAEGGGPLAEEAGDKLIEAVGGLGHPHHAEVPGPELAESGEAAEATEAELDEWPPPPPTDVDEEDEESPPHPD